MTPTPSRRRKSRIPSRCMRRHLHSESLQHAQKGGKLRVAAWTAADAKTRLSELIERAHGERP